MTQPGGLTFTVQSTCIRSYAVRMRVPLLTAVCLLATACTPDVRGVWTGQCVGPGQELRVDIDVWQAQTDDRTEWASVTLNLPDRPLDTLLLTCDAPAVEGRSARLGGCTGGWTSAPDSDGPVDFRIDGQLERADPTPRWIGDCTFEGGDGTLELWERP